MRMAKRLKLSLGLPILGRKLGNVALALIENGQLHIQRWPRDALAIRLLFGIHAHINTNR